jgi:hypothetical protein
MERVKIFTYGTTDRYGEFEKQVNKWLAENDGINIVSRYVTGSAGVNVAGNPFTNCTIVIFYRPAPKKHAPKK